MTLSSDIIPNNSNRTGLYIEFFQNMLSDLDTPNIGEIKELFSALMKVKSSSGDLIKDLFSISPNIVLNLLKMESQDMNGCLSNCTNVGKCNVDASGKFVCKCNEHYTGDDCSKDTRACSSSPCKNNATCIEVTNEGNMSNTYSCSCSSQLFYGMRFDKNMIKIL